MDKRMVVKLFCLGMLLAVGACPHDSARGPDGPAGRDSGDAGAGGDGGSCEDAGGPVSQGEAVLMHHKSLARDGFYVDPRLTRAAVKGLHRDAGFDARVAGPTYAQPLYLPGGGGRKDLLFVATEQNQVYAFDAQGGAQAWGRKLGEPVALKRFDCGNIDPLGITGTPVIDAAARTLYVDAMTSDDGGATKHHLVFALAIDDGGKTRPGWPVDVAQRLGAQGVKFHPEIQNQRGALALVGGVLYVPFGGFYGDCGDYRGWVVGIPVADPQSVKAWSTSARGGGVWAPGGVSSDGSAVYAASGNTFGADTWAGGEAIVRLRAGPVFGGQAADYFAPAEWKDLDAADTDLGGSGPVLVDLACGRPRRLALALGKNGVAYLLDRDRLGGIGGAVASAKVADGEIINAAAGMATRSGALLVFKAPCPGGGLRAVTIRAGTPPALSPAWCADPHGNGSPVLSTTDGSAEALAWSVGAEGDNRLYAFDAASGQVVFGGGGAAEKMGAVSRFQTPILVKGRVFVAGNDRLYAFTP